MFRSVVVDTYALLAMAFDELSERAREVLLAIRRRRIEGLITSFVVYEYALHWRRGRIPALKNLDEVATFLTTYFRIVDLDHRDMVKIAVMKAEGDEILRRCSNETLRNRRISITDASLIYLAKKLGIPILTGDRELQYVAKIMGVETLW